MEMDDRQLKDFGITPEQAEQEAPRNAGRRLISQLDMESKHPIIAAAQLA
jgi:hypothetical protein